MLIAKNGKEIHLIPRMTTRHGLISGSTGSGKTITVQVMAEEFSRIGIPVVVTDIKGDLSGFDKEGTYSPNIQSQLEKMKMKEFTFESFPTKHWDPFGEKGLPLRTTITRLGPYNLSRILNLSLVQEGVLMHLFSQLEVGNQPICVGTPSELSRFLTFLKTTPQAGSLLKETTKTTIAAIQRGLSQLTLDNCERVFDESRRAFNVKNFFYKREGKGVINILHAEKLIHFPKIYATIILWLIEELFKMLPEQGDADPKLAFFFDEAHLLFDDASSILVKHIEKLVRMIRSKGVSVFFITQRPSDIPDSVLGQLGNRVQHALRAYTPKEYKGVRVLAQTFRPNPRLTDVEQAIMSLKTGEALISFLDEEGTPMPVQRAFIRPPASAIGAYESCGSA